jgi:hypothetical protein
MVGVTSIEVKESLEDLAEQLRQAKTPIEMTPNFRTGN